MAAMRRLARLVAAFCLVAVACGASVATGAAPPPPGSPTLRFEAPPALVPEARRLAALDPRGYEPALRLVGLVDAGPPITVVLAPEGTPAAAAPPWIAGYALPGASTVVLLPGRVVPYPNDSPAQVLRHEVAHVLIDRAGGGRPLPRWFHEGVATLAAGEWGAEDQGRLAFSLLVRPPATLRALDDAFEAGGGRTEGAYAVATALVRTLERENPAIVARILAGVRGGLPFEAACRRAGLDVDARAAAFLSHETFLWRWLPILTSSTVLWIGITVLAVVAIRARRRRDRLRRELWDLQDQLAAVRVAGPESGEDDEEGTEESGEGQPARVLPFPRLPPDRWVN